jgi:hypothetical protein
LTGNDLDASDWREYLENPRDEVAGFRILQLMQTLCCEAGA